MKQKHKKHDTANGDTIAAEDYAADKYRGYGIYTLEDRAIPEIHDGLKPVQRRLLYSMWERGIRSTGNYKKSAAIVGDVMARFHPHGDQSLYDALVRMVNPEPMAITPDGSHPFSPISPQGNFGGFPRALYPPAAMRYTEVRLSKIGEVHFECINVAPMEPNFSGEFQEPQVIPTRLPMLLLFGASGVAVGAATEIPAHGLPQVLKCAEYVLQKGDNATVKGAVRHLGGPDYGHSYMISPKEDLLDMYSEGKGTIRYMCSHHIARGKDSHELVVTSYAPGFNPAGFVSLLETLEAEKKIIAFNNESDEDGPRITVLFKNPGVVEDRILPALRTFKAYSWNVVDVVNTVDGSPTFQHVNLLTYLRSWLDWRRDVETVMLQLERTQLREKLHREQAKLAAASNAEILGKIMGSKKPMEEKKREIQAQIKFRWGGKETTLADDQVEYLLEQKIRSMDRLGVGKQQETIREILLELRRIKSDLLDIDAVILHHIRRIQKDFAALSKKWVPTVLAYEVPELELPSGPATGYWHMTAKGFLRGYDALPTRGGKFPEGFLTPAEDSVTVIEASGDAYTLKSVYLTQGATAYRNVVGTIQGSLPVLMVMDSSGNIGCVEHPPKSPEYRPLAMDVESELIGAWGCQDSDTVYAFARSGGKWESILVSALGTKRPNSQGRKLLKGTRKSPLVYVVPKGGFLVANGVGRISPEDVNPGSSVVFVVGKKNYVSTISGKKMILAGVDVGSWVKSDGLSTCYILR